VVGSICRSESHRAVPSCRKGSSTRMRGALARIDNRATNAMWLTSQVYLRTAIEKYRHSIAAQCIYKDGADSSYRVSCDTSYEAAKITLRLCHHDIGSVAMIRHHGRLGLPV
jgi:hypothetical protein